MYTYVQMVIIFERNKLLRKKLHSMWPEASSLSAVNLAKKSSTIPEISNFF